MKLLSIVLLMVFVAVAYCQLANVGASGSLGKREAGFDKEHHLMNNNNFNGEHRETRQVNAGVGGHVGKRSVDKNHFSDQNKPMRAARQVGVNANVRGG